MFLHDFGRGCASGFAIAAPVRHHLKPAHLRGVSLAAAALIAVAGLALVLKGVREFRS